MSEAERVLVVEDEPRQRSTLTKFLDQAGFEVEAVGAAEDALALLGEEQFSALVTDLRLPGIDGLELVRRARSLDEELPTIVVTGFGSMETAVEALRAGAHDYILKPLFYDELVRKLTKLFEHRDLLRENARLRGVLQDREATDIVGVSEATQEVIEWVHRAASTSSTVLITGDTGTGKEVVARAIHKLGPDSEAPFVTVNLAALPENMVESELFGYERGAFTGAHRQRDGMLRAAGSGTVFLDEIGELPLALQAKLLRALEAREVQPIGRDKPVKFEARILCATHRDLRKRIKDGEFREDLYYRLNILQIHIPPLRARREDIPPLAHHLLERLCARGGVGLPVIKARAMQVLCRYRWPGNVRELANVLERALILADEGEIDAEHLPAELEEDVEGERKPLKEALDDFEKRYIALVLRKCEGNRECAAKELGLSIATLYRRLERLGLQGDKASDI